MFYVFFVICCSLHPETNDLLQNSNLLDFIFCVLHIDNISETTLLLHFRSSPAAPLVEISPLWCHTVHWSPLVSNHTSMPTVGSALCGRFVFPNMWEVQCLVCSYFWGVQDDRMKTSCSKSEDVALAEWSAIQVTADNGGKQANWFVFWTQFTLTDWTFLKQMFVLD